MDKQLMLKIGEALRDHYPVAEQLPATMQLQLLRLQAKEGMDKK